MIKLTSLESQALKGLWTSSRGNGHDFGFGDDASVEKKSKAGVVSSLSRKGIIDVYPGEGSDKFSSQIVFTEKGMLLFTDFQVSPNLKESVMTATATKPTTTKTTKNTEKGLRKPQVRILQALVKAGKGMDRKTLAAKAPVDVAACVEYLGSHDDKVRVANDKKHFPSLISLGYVKAEQKGEKEPITYSIKPEGKKALDKALKAG